MFREQINSYFRYFSSDITEKLILAFILVSNSDYHEGDNESDLLLRIEKLSILFTFFYCKDVIVIQAVHHYL